MAVTAVALAGLLGRGHLDQLINFRNGGLFVHSSARQALHHVDLASGKVDYAMPLDAGDFDVVNTGGVTVARNRQTGAATIIDLSDASGKASRALLLEEGVELVAGGGEVFALNREAGMATPIDATGAAAGGPARTGGQIEGTAAVDDKGRLWAPVPSKGEIVPVDAQRQGGRTRGVAVAPARLADPGVPLDVTVFNRTAYGIAHRADGTIISRLAPGAATHPLSYPGQLVFAAVQGEADGNHLAGLDRANEALVRIDVSTGRAQTIPVQGRAAKQLDPPVQAGSKLIVPDPQRGDVVVIDADQPGTQTAVAVADGPGPLDIQVKDGAVVVNAPNGSRAVEFDQDGKLTTIDKFVPVPTPRDHLDPAPARPPTVRPAPAGPGAGRGPLVTVAPEAPGVPVNLAAVGGRGQVSLSWQPPPSTRATVAEYVISGPRGETKVPSGKLAVSVPADDEVPVVFRIRAVNASGSSPPADFPSATPTSQVPGKVGAVRATPGNQQVNLSWPAPPANGTSIDAYVVTGSNGSSTRVPGTATTATVDKLVNGTGYTFTVQAMASSSAAGDPSDPTAAVVPFGPPVPPAAFSALALNGGARAEFAPSDGDGNGRPVERYEAMASIGTPAQPSASSPSAAGKTPPLDVLGLTNGTGYSVWVRTVTAGGPGPWSAPRPVTPTGLPVVTLTGASLTGDRQLTGTFTVAANGPAPTRCVLVVTGKETIETAGGCNAIGLGGLAYSAEYVVSAYAEGPGGRGPLSNRISVRTCDKTDGAVGIARTPSGKGYWLVDGRGAVSCFGDAGYYQSRQGQHLNRPMVGISATSSGNGYWLVAADGGVFAFGDARFIDSMASRPLNKPIVAMAASPTGNGYWLVGADGGIFAFGDVRFHASHASEPLNKPVVTMAATATGNGYWLVAADGGVFAYGDARYIGSHASNTLNLPVVGMAATATGNGYWFAAADGGVFAYGDAPFHGSHGSAPLNKPITGMAVTASGDGYWLVAGDGGVFAYGAAKYLGPP